MMATELDINITDAEITAKAKEIAKKQLLDDKRKLEARRAAQAAEKKKAAEKKALKAKIEAERKEFVANLPKFFNEKLDTAILKNMERYVASPEMRWLDKLYKIAIIKRELLGGHK